MTQLLMYLDLVQQRNVRNPTQNELDVIYSVLIVDLFLLSSMHPLVLLSKLAGFNYFVSDSFSFRLTFILLQL